MKRKTLQYTAAVGRSVAVQGSARFVVLRDPATPAAGLVRACLLHVVRLCRSGQLRFRLETFGLYYPSAPYARAWWKVSPTRVWQLMRATSSYGRWLVDMDVLGRDGAHGWWERRHTSWEGIDDE